MFSTLATKFGAIALTPFLFFGGGGQVAHDASVKSNHAQADTRGHLVAHATTDDSDSDTSCTELEYTLRFGMRDRSTGGEVSELQAFLHAEGYLRSEPTGFYGPSTWRAVRSFQADHSLRVTGIVDLQTRLAIETQSCDGEGESLAITSITAPTALAIDEEGTWTVHVDSETEGNLTYAVRWGDENQWAAARMSAEGTQQSSATFTHQYAAAGTYTPEFTVTNASGETVSRAAASVVVSEEGDVDVSITSLNATTGHAGDRITITGAGFTGGTEVYVGNTKATDVAVASDTSIAFTMPTLGAGSYDVYVVNENGTSNALRFELTAKAAVRVSISGIDAPARLAVDQEGTWTVNATTNSNGNLRYAVTWGDEGAMRMMSSANTQTSSTFTHAYASAGAYSPKFTVTDIETGKSSSVSATVVVSQ